MLRLARFPSPPFDGQLIFRRRCKRYQPELLWLMFDDFESRKLGKWTFGEEDDLEFFEPFVEVNITLRSG